MMRRISLEQIQPGMVAAKAVYGSRGQVLLNTGAEVKPHYARYLKGLGIYHLYVYDSRLEGVEVDDVVTERTRLEARFLIKNVMSKVEKGKDDHKSILLEDKAVVRTIGKIIDELLSNRDVVVNLMDIRTAEEYMFAHSVNTCFLATLTAIKLKHQGTQIKNIAMGTLLHDMGNTAIPPEILKKPSSLTRDEFEIVKRHPVYGFEAFKRSNMFSAGAGAIIYQHHERAGGQGYPEGRKGDQINPLAKIASLANVYDALTSDRPYRKAYLPHQSIEMLQAMGSDHFDLDILKTFLSFIAAYPVGTHVMLTNKESGLVVKNTPGFPTRPVVRILYEGDGLAPHPNPYEIDLTEKLDIVIESVL